MVKDGRFYGKDGSIPEGQGIVMAHLNECHELLELVSPFFFYSTIKAWSDCDIVERVNGGRIV
jgi:hypothetical protein